MTNEELIEVLHNKIQLLATIQMSLLDYCTSIGIGYKCKHIKVRIRADYLQMYVPESHSPSNSN